MTMSHLFDPPLLLLHGMTGSAPLIDVAIIFTGLNNDDAGKAVRRLLDQFPDVRSNSPNFKFSGKGQKEVAVAPLIQKLKTCHNRHLGNVTSFFLRARTDPTKTLAAAQA